jgi:hypothetical protein
MALAANIEAVRRLVTELARDVEAGAKPKGKKGDGAGPLSWLDMAGTNRDPAQVLIEVADFLEAVYLRYTDGAKSFPDCWLWHPDVVEELVWLMDAWRASRDPEAPAHLVGDWHDRMRPGVVKRIRDYAGQCSLEHHKPGGKVHGPALRAPHRDAIPEISTWWATHRRGPGPAPTDAQLAEADKTARRR